VPPDAAAPPDDGLPPEAVPPADAIAPPEPCFPLEPAPPEPVAPLRSQRRWDLHPVRVLQRSGRRHSSYNPRARERSRRCLLLEYASSEHRPAKTERRQFRRDRGRARKLALGSRADQRQHRVMRIRTSTTALLFLLATACNSDQGSKSGNDGGTSTGPGGLDCTRATSSAAEWATASRSTATTSSWARRRASSSRTTTGRPGATQHRASGLAGRRADRPW